MPPKKSSNSSSSASSAAFANPADELQMLLAFASDHDRLARLKNVWENQSTAYIDQLVTDYAKELSNQASQYSSTSSSITSAAQSHLRNVLGLLALIARREFPQVAAGKKNMPLQVFPGCVESLLVLLEAVEREIEGASSNHAAHEIKFHALHAFNRLLEGFPDIVAAFVPLTVEVVTRELFPVSAASPSSASVASPFTASAYGTKLVETLGLVAASQPRALLKSAHELLKNTLNLIAQSLEGVESYVAPAAPAAAAGESKVQQVSPAHQFTLSLLDFASVLIKKLHQRLPVSYPSSRLLMPRAWPFGSEELGGAREGDEPEDEDEDAGRDDDEEELDEEMEEGEEGAEEKDAASPSGGAVQLVAPGPRACFTESLSFNPVRKGAMPLVFENEDEASALFEKMRKQLWILHTKIGIEGASSTAPGQVNDAGNTILAFLPFVFLLDNLYAAGTEQTHANHGQHMDILAQDLIEQLRELDLSAFSAPLLSSCFSLLRCLEYSLAYSRRSATLEYMQVLYNDLVNWTADAQSHFPRAAFLKLRRAAVATFMPILYTFDVEFPVQITAPTFFAELFPLLANPLLTSHLIYLMREAPEADAKKVLAQVMRGLLNTNTRSSPSVKTVQMILTSIGNVACFTRAYQNPPNAAGATLPLLAPYMSQLLETVINTMEKSPSGTGQVASLVLCRIVMCAYEMSEVSEYISRILELYLGIIDERLFVAEQAEQGEEYDEDDQDLVSQLQYCVLDMLHAWLQDMKEAALDPVNRGMPDKGHPFDQAKFVEILSKSEASMEVLENIMQVLLENTKKPTFFNDDAALRNSEIHLLKEILSHPSLFQKLLVDEKAPSEATASSTPVPASADASAASASPAPAPLPAFTPANLLITLLGSIQAAKVDGQGERKYNYVLCLGHIATFFPQYPAIISQLKSALQDSSNKKLLADIQKDSESWKIIQAWTK